MMDKDPSRYLVRNQMIILTVLVCTLLLLVLNNYKIDYLIKRPAAGFAPSATGASGNLCLVKILIFLLLMIPFVAYLSKRYKFFH